MMKITPERGHLIRTLGAALRMAVPYFRSEDRWKAWPLLVGVIAMQLGTVAVAVAMNQWRNDFFQALEQRSWEAFVAQFWVFAVIGLAFVVVTTYQTYLRQWLTIRWRQWMTERLLGRWLDGPVHYRLHLSGNGVDNPDQRIAEDVRFYIERTLELTMGLLGAVTTLFSFVAVLWTISALMPPVLFERTWTIPGYLVWLALVYAIIGTLITHWIGRKLVGIDFERERREADFRFSLARLRENASSVALLHGAAREYGFLHGRFRAIVENWYGLMNRLQMVNLFRIAYRHYGIYLPYLMIGPLYFNGVMPLGTLMQSGSAFNQVRQSFFFFIESYDKLADLGATVQRLSGFMERMTTIEADPAFRVDSLPASAPGAALEVRDLAVYSPDEGHLLSMVDRLEVAKGERLLITGDSGAGKTSLFRTIAGIWPCAEGVVRTRADRVLVLPQRPYMPQGSLREALTYPQPDTVLSEEEARAVLRLVGLERLDDQLDERNGWAQRLSEGEQQRLALARVLVLRPDLLLLDEATSALEGEAEMALHALVQTALPETAIVAVSHRPSLKALYPKIKVMQAPRTAAAV